MDLIRERMLMSNRKGSDEEMATWETLIDYTTTEELGTGNNDVERYDSTVLEKLNNAKKIAVVCYFAPPSMAQSVIGSINVNLYMPNKYMSVVLTGECNTLPNSTSGVSSLGYIYRQIDNEALQSVGIKEPYPIYAPTVSYLKDTFKYNKLDRYWFNNGNFVDATILRLVVSNGVVGKGSRIRVLVMS